jgi:hypothetical protein
MDEAMVFPDPTMGMTKKMKETNQMVKSIYTPFLSHFFGKEGVLTREVRVFRSDVMSQLMKMVEALYSIFEIASGDLKLNQDNTDPESLKKKKKESSEKWYTKVIKFKWFEKVSGWIKGLATTSWITELITFVILLRMGILQRFLPWFGGIIGSAISTLIRMIPKLLKWIFHLLWVTFPKILREIFNSVLDVLGINNPAIRAFADAVAQFLPILAAFAWLGMKLAPVFNFLKSIGQGIVKVLKWIWPILTSIWGWIQLIAYTLGIAVGWVVAIIAAIIAIGVLIYFYWEEIMSFFSWLGSAINTYVIQPIANIFIKIWGIFKLIIKLYKAIGKALYKLFIEPIIKAFKSLWNKISGFLSPLINKALTWLGNALTSVINSIVSPIKKAFGAVSKIVGKVTTPLKKVFSGIGDFFGMIGDKISEMITRIKGVFISLIDMFSNIGTYGYEWFTMDDKEKATIMGTQKEIAGNTTLSLIKDIAEGDIELESIKGKVSEAQYKEIETEVTAFRNRKEDDFNYTQWKAEQRLGHEKKTKELSEMKKFVINDNASNK